MQKVDADSTRGGYLHVATEPLQCQSPHCQISQEEVNGIPMTTENDAGDPQPQTPIHNFSPKNILIIEI